MAPRRALGAALLLAALLAVAAQNQTISGLHVFRWFTGGGGMCQTGMSVADCSYRRLLMRHMKNNLETCQNPLTTNTMSVSHRGAPLIYPEHTYQGIQRAVNDGAYWIECDTVPTKVRKLLGTEACHDAIDQDILVPLDAGYANGVPSCHL
jgi:hypothetical protein